MNTDLSDLMKSSHLNKPRNSFLLILPLLFTLGLSLLSCVSQRIQPIKKTLLLKQTPSNLEDDLKLYNLIPALEANIQTLKEKKNEFLSFGDMKIKRTLYIKALSYFLDLMKLEKTNLRKESGLLFDFIQKNFDFYAIDLSKKGRRKKKSQLKSENVFITSYYAPILEGSPVKTKTHSQPIYKTPKDLVRIRTNEFKKAFLKVSNYEENYKKKNFKKRKRKRKKGRSQKNKVSLDQEESFSGFPSISWGRILTQKKEGDSASFPLIVPFYSREEIDSQLKILDKDLILAWVSPLDAFFIQIQGSGIVEFKDGKRLSLGYHSQNGFPYVPVGKYVDLPPEEVTMNSIISYFLSLPEEKRQDFLNLNPSYVFFRELQNKRSITFFGNEAAPGRTIATDPNFFPKGALAYLEFKKPLFSKDHQVQPENWKKVSRFVIDQDIGGAIQGPHRLDLFWGEGKVARQHAGVMKNWGKIYYLTPKEPFLKMLTESEKTKNGK